jgi:RHS repeat-associated protein
MGRNYLTEGPFFSSGSGYPQNPPAQYSWSQSYFDERGRVIETESPDSTYGSVSVTFDYNGLETTVIDPDNKKKREKKDYLGRLIQVVEDPGGLNYVTTYEYNAAGDLLTVTDAAGNITEIEYDTLGRKLNMTDPDMGYWQYTYDANGNLKTQTDAKGQVTTFSYDALNRVTNKTYTNTAPESATNSVAYTYDDPSVPNSIGRLTQVTNGDVTTDYDEYDIMGRAISVTRSISGDSNLYTTTTAYDLSGKVVSTTYPDGYEVRQEYYPGTGLLQQVYGVNDFQIYGYFSSYEPSGKIGQMEHGNATATIYTYDPWSTRLTALLTEDPSGQPANDIQRKIYQYSKAGDVKWINNQLTGIMYDYTYDPLHRLTGESSNSPEPARVDKNIENFFDSLTPVHAVKQSIVNGTNYFYQYDANGNMTTGYDFTDPQNIATRTIIYNADNMPTRIEHTDKGITELLYDGDGARARKETLNSTTYYIGGHYEVTNGVATRYVFAGSIRLAMQTDLHPTDFTQSSPETYYYHKDHLGSSSAMTDSSGVTISTSEYLPYGGSRSSWESPGAPDTPYKYTDQEHDPETGLYNYNARLYDPVTGMFISPDTIVPDFSDPQTLNRYMYARGNPLVYVDPSGNSFFGIEFVIGAIVGAIFSGAQSNWDVGAMFTGAFIGGISGGVFGGVEGAVSGSLTGAVAAATQVPYAINGGLLAMANIGGSIAGGAAAGVTAGGLGAAFSGGDIGQGIINGAIYGAASGALSGLLKCGWEYTRGATNSSSLEQWKGLSYDDIEEIYYTTGVRGPTYNSAGDLMSAGTRLSNSQVKSLLARFSMKGEGSATNKMFGIPYNSDSPIGHFINRVSKVHDFMNSWRYVSGKYNPFGNYTFDTLFDVYSFAGMPIAGAYTAFSFHGSSAYTTYMLTVENK